MTSPAPLLLTERQARALLAGADPAAFTPPIRVGKRKFFSVAALDLAVRRKAGLATTESGGARDQAPSAYDHWKRAWGPDEAREAGGADHD